MPGYWQLVESDVRATWRYGETVSLPPDTTTTATTLPLLRRLWQEWKTPSLREEASQEQEVEGGMAAEEEILLPGRHRREAWLQRRKYCSQAGTPSPRDMQDQTVVTAPPTLVGESAVPSSEAALSPPSSMPPLLLSSLPPSLFPPPTSASLIQEPPPAKRTQKPPSNDMS
jgi:hypothetical protein